MPEDVVCNLCGGDDTRVLYRARDYRFGIDSAVWTVVECRRCGLGYLNPQPTPDELERYYPFEYFADRSGEQAAARYSAEAAYVPDVGGRKLLDIGTATGEFLREMQNRGFQAEGIEPAAAAGNPHGLPIRRLRFPEEAGDLEEEAYDVVTAWAVFEHLHRPDLAFAEVARILRRGGALVLQVPNLRSVFGRWSRQEDIPRHLYFFSPRTLAAYGHLAGLVLESVHHTTELYGGSGRGVLRLGIARLFGHTTVDFFEIYGTARRERLQRWPVLFVPWTLAGLIERVILADTVVRALRISGQIVAIFRKDGAQSR